MASPQQQPMMVAPQAYMAAPPAPKVFSIWWPMSFLIAWVVMSAIGGGLTGAGLNSVSTYCDDYYCSSYGDEGLYYGGLACLAIASVCGLVFWVLLIIFLVKRSRARHPTVVYGNNLAPAAAPAGYYPYAYPGGLAPQYAPQQQQQQQAYVPAAMPHASMVPKQEGKACSSCGTVSATPYCPQCGSQVV